MSLSWASPLTPNPYEDAAYYDELKFHRSLGEDAPILVPSGTKVASHRCQSSVAFTTIIVEFRFRHRQVS